MISDISNGKERAAVLKSTYWLAVQMVVDGNTYDLLGTCAHLPALTLQPTHTLLTPLLMERKRECKLQLVRYSMENR